MGAATRALLRARLRSERLLVNTTCVDLPVCPTCGLQSCTRERSKRNSLCFPPPDIQEQLDSKTVRSCCVGRRGSCCFCGCLSRWCLVPRYWCTVAEVTQQWCATTLRRVCGVPLSVFFRCEQDQMSDFVTILFISATNSIGLLI